MTARGRAREDRDQRGPGAKTVMAMAAEQRWSDLYAELACEIVGDFDLAELLHHLADRCVDLGLAGGVGIVVADEKGHLRDIVYSSERIRGFERLQIELCEGPCIECFQRGEPVEEPDLAGGRPRWARFAPAAVRLGVRSVRAVPLHLRDRVVGTLNLFDDQVSEPRPDLMRTAQGMADLATLSLTAHVPHVAAEELELRVATALVERSTIERAKGFLAEKGGISVDEAFEGLRAYARHERVPLTHLARQVEIRAIPVDAVLAAARRD